MVGEQKREINEVTNVKIGKFAREYFAKYFSNTSTQYDLKSFLNRYWCHDTFGICYPLLKEIDISMPISRQKGYNNEYARYWVKPILEINQKHYILCSEWYPQFREKLDKWIEDQKTQIPDYKMDVYILPKFKTKTCSKCGNKTEKEILYVTYHTAIADIKNQLFTRRCKSCEITYMADTIFKSYTRSKDIGDININFIKQDI